MLYLYIDLFIVTSDGSSDFLHLERSYRIGERNKFSAVGGFFVEILLDFVGFPLSGLGFYYIITSVVKKTSAPTAPKQSQA